MEKQRGFNLIKNKHTARMLAIVLISIALILVCVEYAVEVAHGAFTYEYTFEFVFEVIANVILIRALFKKNPTLIEISLVVLKVFEGFYYPLASAQQLDALLKDPNTETANYVAHILFAVAAASLFAALILFCFYKVKDNIKYWTAMKVCVLVSAFMMFVTTIFGLVFIIMLDYKEWELLLSPVALTILFVGMFNTYEYVEEEIIYNE
ncbi:MAG: hypothetical protein K5906_01000 [Bacilli bacterium]|nr:hypothetical protein [Bacilli bacterium]